MKPIYFPFTYISEPTATTLASSFPQTVVYQTISENMPETMKKYAEKGLLEIRTPIENDAQKIDAIIKDYKNWTSLHQGAGMEFFKTQKNRIPFFDDTSSIQIRSEIKKHKSGKQQEEEKPDPLLNARIFLQIAQELDMQKQEITLNFGAIDTMEQNLMKYLKDEDSEIEIPTAKIGIPADDPGNYMTSERLNAWAYLMGHDPESEGLFVTNSRAMIELMLDKVEDMKMVCEWNTIPVYSGKENETQRKWHDELSEFLEMLITSETSETIETFPDAPKDESSNHFVSLQIYMAKEKTPTEFFNHFLSFIPEPAKEKKYDGIKNTLICLIEFQSY